jgi:raffinose/stachyose/melibiose transport system substrate-binding protein
MSFKKIIPFYKTTLLLLIFSVLVFSTACSSAGGEEPEPTPSQVKKPDKVNDAVTVRFMIHGYNDIFSSLSNEFTSQNPDINIELLMVENSMYDQVKAQKLSTSDVDVVINFQTNPLQTDWAKDAIKPQFQQEIEMGYYADLTDIPYLKNWKQTALEESSMLEGRVYAVPFALSALNIVFYNKTIFRENGLEVPETWDEFVNICKIMRERKIKPLIVGGKDSWPLLMISNAFVAANETDLTSFAKDLWTRERKFNDEKSLKIWEMAFDFATYLPMNFNKIEYASIPERFANGEAAMLADGSWQAFSIMDKNPSIELGCFTLPGYTKGTDPVQISCKYDMMLSVNDKSPNREAALKWLEFLCEPQNYKKFVEEAQVIPVADIEVDNEFIKSLAPYMQNPSSAWEHIMPVHSNVKLARFSSYVQYGIILGHYTSPKHLADSAQYEWDKILDSIDNN